MSTHNITFFVRYADINIEYPYFGNNVELTPDTQICISFRTIPEIVRVPLCCIPLMHPEAIFNPRWVYFRICPTKNSRNAFHCIPPLLYLDPYALWYTQQEILLPKALWEEREREKKREREREGKKRRMRKDSNATTFEWQKNAHADIFFIFSFFD